MRAVRHSPGRALAVLLPLFALTAGLWTWRADAQLAVGNQWPHPRLTVLTPTGAETRVNSEPDRANGFEGTIQYDLQTARGTRHWAVRIDGRRAVAEPRVDDGAVVTIRTSVPVFARIAARELPPAKALLEGDFEVTGNFEVASRLGEMFGEPSPW